MWLKAATFFCLFSNFSKLFLQTRFLPLHFLQEIFSFGGLQITRDYFKEFARQSCISLHFISSNWQLGCCVSVMQPALFGSPLLSAVNCEDDWEVLVGMICYKQSMYRPFAAFLKDGRQPCLWRRCEPCLLEAGVRNTESWPSNSRLGNTSRVTRQKIIHATYCSVAGGYAAVIDHRSHLPVVIQVVRPQNDIWLCSYQHALPSLARFWLRL